MDAYIIHSWGLCVQNFFSDKDVWSKKFRATPLKLFKKHCSECTSINVFILPKGSIRVVTFDEFICRNRSPGS